MPGRELIELLAGGAFFESPRWHDGRWWISDFYRHQVLTVESDGSTAEVMTVGQQPSGLGWMPDGSMLVVSMKDHRLLRRSPAGQIGVHADLSGHRRRFPGARLRRRVRVRPHGVRRSGAGQAHARRPRRRRHGARGRSSLPQRLGDHTRRRHADRRGDGRCSLHRFYACR